MQPLIFLHGALGNKLHWERFMGPFNDKYAVHNINFPGHGKSDTILTSYTLETLTYFLKQYLADHQLENCIIIGYSMGGYIALNLAAQKHSTLHSVITLATKLEWNNDIAKEESSKLSDQNLMPLMEKLRNEHGENMNGLIDITKSILVSIGQNPLRKDIFRDNKTPVTMLRGSKDRMVSGEETISFAEGLSFFNTLELDNQPHLLERMDKDIVCGAILKTLSRF